jgi:hypothetical protein
MRWQFLAALAVFLLSAQAYGQLPAAQPQNQADFYSSFIEIELRLKRADGTTARVHVPKFGTMNAGAFTVTVPCWNKASACPAVVAVTARVSVLLPWIPTKSNVTKYVLCNGSECQLYYDDGTPSGSPTFPAISAKPGEGYQIRFDRLKGRITPQPIVVAVLAPPPPPPPASGVSPDGTKMPPAAELVDSSGAKWTVSAVAGNQYVVFRNGVQVAGSVDFLEIKGGVIYQSDFLSGSGWFRWTGSGWEASAQP